MQLKNTVKMAAFAVGVMAFSYASSLVASETDAIADVRFDPVEMHFGDITRIELIPRERLGDMPVPILDDTGNGFVKILLPDGTEGWINRADVQVGGVEIEAICSRYRVYAAAADYKEAQLRGVSRKCE